MVEMMAERDLSMAHTTIMLPSPLGTEGSNPVPSSGLQRGVRGEPNFRNIRS